jgi:hypothetical protein
MEAFKISVKLFVEKDQFGPAEFVPVFHRWIQDKVLEDHLAIDVADYAHVPAGPGSLLVAHEANVHMDRVEDRLGLLYFRKTASPGTFADRLKAAILNAIKAAAKMEQEEGFAGRLKFRTDELQIRLNDRLNAPNTPQTFAAVKADLEAIANDLYGAGKGTVEYVISPKQVFTVKVTGPSTASASDLAARFAPVGA